VVVSGIGCTGRIAGYVNIDSYHTTHGRPIAFATGMKLANPELQVTVFSGDGDLLTIGGNHWIHAARRNINMNVFCVNNFNYGMTGGQFGATTPRGAWTTTSQYGNFEHPFNLPLMTASLGAPFVSRWTTLHVQQLRQAMERAMEVDGFSFIEIISPCPIGFGRKNEFRDAMEQMNHYLNK
ncbi:MAG: thiamine pyrophosphate-dependent enzyme, partial [Candidatus Thermoplasmatota archaeon]|nr:thiamine pyrophosphate-dependent enzyme [Candidatus Thermoplasmatota archaeon]